MVPIIFGPYIVPTTKVIGYWLFMNQSAGNGHNSYNW